MSVDKNVIPGSEESLVSVITPSLNHGHFLRGTIESVLDQSYKNVEHVIVDGCSTDNTIEILKEYPNIKWISEKEGGDNKVLDATWKAFYLSRGKYIVFLCVSDGISDRDWFKKGVEILDRDRQVSHVWGLSQNMSEDGQRGKLWWAEFLEHPPPQKMDFLPFWLATRHGVECNAIYRRDIFESCHPKNSLDEPYRYVLPHGLNYNLNTRGYLPYFIPIIALYGRDHKGQRQEMYRRNLEEGDKRYNSDIERYKKDLLSGKIKHCFRDGDSQIICELPKEKLREYGRIIRSLRLKRSLQRKFQRILDRIGR